MTEEMTALQFHVLPLQPLQLTDSPALTPGRTPLSTSACRNYVRNVSRSPSTISRELRRNATHALGYLPYSAHRMAAARRQRPKERKLERPARLRQYVGHGLHRRWSPEQISRRLVKDFPGDLEMWVGTDAIYQAIYLHGRGIETRDREPDQIWTGDPQATSRPYAAHSTVP